MIAKNRISNKNRVVKGNQYDDAWIGLGDTSKIKLPRKDNPLLNRTEWDMENPGLLEVRVMSNPRYIWLAAKVLLNIELLPMQCVVLQQLEAHQFPMYVASRGFGKSFLLAVYSLLKLALTPLKPDGAPGCKIVIVGAAFRQSKIIFDYMDTIWQNAPILRSIASKSTREGPRKETDRCTMTINKNTAIAVPLGDGMKIRGLRATIIIADEFAAIPPHIYETVVSGFAAVSANPTKGVRDYAKRSAMQADNVWTSDQENIFKSRTGNKAIISGTADYDFKHFAEYWKRYKSLIQANNDTQKFKQLLNDENDTELEFNSDDFAVIRIPYECIPKGFMDDKIVARAKATVDSGVYMTEYGAVFVADSSGFFKRSLIEKCTGSDLDPIKLPSGEIYFDAAVRGNHTLKYVFGIDPASENDNFSIVIVELHEDHTRVVYSWTTNRSNFKERARKGITQVGDFYGFCARKIRDLMKLFPPVAIGIDAQGGGIAIEEALQDPDKINSGEQAILQIIDPDKEKDSDALSGLHILHMVQFAKADWTSEAHHGLKKDMEDQVLLFPRFDPIVLELALVDDKMRVDQFRMANGKELTLYDTLEDCVMEIEELKTELTTIVHSCTPAGRERWDTPEIKQDSGKKGHMRKDRVSSIVIANMLARGIHRQPSAIEFDVAGGFATDLAQDLDVEQMYQGAPEWLAKGMDGDTASYFGRVGGN